MTIEQRVSHFREVGKFLAQFQRKGIKKNPDLPHNEEYFDKLLGAIETAIHYNGWFTRDNVLFALEQWSKALNEDNLYDWIKNYHLDKSSSKTVAIILAGNIPLVGFHDFLSVLMAGHKVIVKQSSNDQRVLPIIASYLLAIEPEYQEKISFTEGRLPDFDAVIATGSNNTSRYFEYYFAGKPSIIRKNRNSVAVLSGDETQEELQPLGDDIFRYFGLGCRNVSKLYLPEGFDFDPFYKAMTAWENLLDHAKYANNYDYNKAVYLMSEFKFLDNGFLLLKEDPSFGSPIATLFYETYSSIDVVREILKVNSSNIQCVVSGQGLEGEISLGQTQQPLLMDYADNIDTLAFLQDL